MALEGTVHTPIGEFPKKYVVIGGIGLAVLIGIGYYRSKKSKAATPTDTSNIDPATGFVYGSADDQNALAAQGSALPTAVPGGASQIPSLNSAAGFQSNGQWAQNAEQYLVAQGLIVDPTALSAALGAYITGQPVTSDAEHSLISQAIAFDGYPPIAGPNGYPPAINTNNPTPTPPTPTTTPSPTPRQTKTNTTGADMKDTDFVKGTGITVAQLIEFNPQYWFPKGMIHAGRTLFISP